MALGGGCEILLHCDAVQAHAETYMGLVEAGVGVIPGWGGCKEMLTRWQTNPKRPGGPMPGVAKVFETISTAQVATSAEEARGFLFLRDGDGITINRERLLADAKAKALELVAGYRPAGAGRDRPARPVRPGDARLAVADCAPGAWRRHTTSWSPRRWPRSSPAARPTSTETDPRPTLLRPGARGLLGLVRTPATLDRIEHTLDTGKPLRN